MGLKLTGHRATDKQKKSFLALFFKTTIYCGNMFKSNQIKHIQIEDFSKAGVAPVNGAL
jgi:hypothetical protein